MKLWQVIVLTTAALFAGAAVGSWTATVGIRDAQAEIRRYGPAISHNQLDTIQRFARVLWRESSTQACVDGDSGRPHPAFGPAQFQRRTFEMLRDKYQLPTTLQWRRPEDQLVVLWVALCNGEDDHWTTLK